MPTPRDRALRALRQLIRPAHLAGPDDLPALAAAAGAELGAQLALVHVVDYDQVSLVPLLPDPAGSSAESLSIDGTLAGRAFVEIKQHVSTTTDCPTMWTPLLDGTERLGVLQLEFPSTVTVDDDLRESCLDVAALVAEHIQTRGLYGDLIERARRRTPLTLPAEMQWRILPPLTFVSPRVAISAVLAPAAEVAGDSFDYAMNGDTLHVTILDAMGHGLEATLLASVAIAAQRNARRAGLDLAATVGVMDAEIASEFGPDKFVTGIVGELDVSTGWWRWSTCGHHPALLVRRGRVVKALTEVTGAPLGLGMLTKDPDVGRERLEPGDRLLLYTDGVIEARDASGAFFGAERLVEFVSTQAAAGRPAAETLRRLNQAILNHQEGALQDDATTVMVEWLTNQAGPSTPDP